MTSYSLKKPWALRGWEGLPYALVDTNKKNVFFLSREEFEALNYCDGYIDIDWKIVPPKTREILHIIEKKGFIERHQESFNDKNTIEDWQCYKFYNCRYIKMAHWSITGRCNYRCKHCYMSAPNAKYGELSFEECIRIIDELAECGVMRMSITGGEPLVRSDFWELVDHMLEKGIQIRVIYSNGALVTDKFLDELDNRNIKPEINMSYDGVGWHDWLRGVDGAERAVIDAFRRCHERGFPTAAEMCIFQSNKDTIRQSINKLAELGVAHIKTNPVSGVGEWLEHGADQSISIDETFEKYLEYIPHFYEDGMPMTVHLGGFFMGRKGKFAYYDVSRRFSGDASARNTYVCGHARQIMYLSANGRVLPCMALSGMDIQEKFPSITENSLQECLSDSSYIDMLTCTLDDYLKANPECAECEHSYHCGAGCRASALNYNEQWLAKDETMCKMYKGGYRKRLYDLVNGLGVEIR